MLNCWATRTALVCDEGNHEDLQTVSLVLFANVASISMNAAIGGAAQLRSDHAPERVSTAEPGSGLDVNVFHSDRKSVV